MPAAVRLVLASLALFLLSLAAYLPGTLAASNDPLLTAGLIAGQTVETALGPSLSGLCSSSATENNRIQANEPKGSDIDSDDGLPFSPDDESDDSQREGAPSNGELLEDEVDRDELLLIGDFMAPMLMVDERISSRTGPSPVDGSARFLEKPPRL
jgi:hypothetical protein